MSRRFTFEAEFDVAWEDIRSTHPVLAGPVCTEVGDEEALVTTSELGLTVVMGIIRKTYTLAMRDALISMRGIVGSVCVDQPALADPVRLEISETEAMFTALARAYQPAREA